MDWVNITNKDDEAGSDPKALFVTDVEANDPLHGIFPPLLSSDV